MTEKRQSMSTNRDMELYKESIEQLKSINVQVKSPGEYVAARLESVALDDIRRELKALLASCQSNASGVLMSLFASATPYNETIESTIESVVPFKQLLLESMNNLGIKRDELKQTKWEVKLEMYRYIMVSYAKMALDTHLDATKHLDNIAEEIIDSFTMQDCDALKVGGTVVQKAIVMVTNVRKQMANAEEMLKSHKKYNVATNWALFEIIPREITRIQELLKRCRHYETEVSKYLEHYSKLLKEVDPDRYKQFGSILTEERRTNVQKVLEMEKVIEWNEVERFYGEYDIDASEKNIAILHHSLKQLTVTCAQTAMTILFTLYTEREKLKNNAVPSIADRVKLTDDIMAYVTGLSSLIKGAEQLQRIGAKGDVTNSMPFVDIFRIIFVKPVVDTCISTSIQTENGITGRSPQEEANKFGMFVDKSIDLLLKPEDSIAMQLLNDVTKAAGNDNFKVCCLFDAIAAELLQQIEKHFAAIYFPIYRDRFIENVRAYERLLEHIEIAAGNYKHYLKWRGTDVANNISRCFSIGVVCDNYIEDITRELSYDIATSTDVTGKVFHDHGQAFYLTPSMVLHRQLIALLSHKNFFYHLMPQYLRGASEMIQEYVKYIQSRVSTIEDGCTNDGAEGTKAAEAAIQAAYMLNDLDTIERAIKTGSINLMVMDVSTLSSETQEYGAYLMYGNAEDGSEPGSLTPSHSSSSTETGITTSTNISDNQSVQSGYSGGDDSTSETASKCEFLRVNPNNDIKTVVSMKGKVDGSVVTEAVKRLDYPLQMAFKRLTYALVTDDGTVTVDVAQRSIAILSAIWKDPSIVQGGLHNGETRNCTDGDLANDMARLGREELIDLEKLVTFTKKSVELLYNFFNSAHEQIDGIKYMLENFIIQNLVSSARCSLQFLQSMPSKFRTANKPSVTKASNYVKYMLIPLLSFKEFKANTLSQELARKIMTQTVAKLSNEYRDQVIKLLQNVENLNRSLSSAKNTKDQGTTHLIADLNLIRAQLNIDIEEYVNQCETRLEIERNDSEDLCLLTRCVDAMEERS
ncbi:conserved oligomeric Golgi complex subunit, putative [Babesia ovis]|uniref:Conserved oligomeric Golgi complex subunit, putative n=1 Tax=Babesia ovis TaxID=5869 RepID=A0A9W5WU91_BABOV|nr:conserved oligomeric Golgi complex subunit, putative [Babesia ovis]